MRTQFGDSTPCYDEVESVQNNNIVLYSASQALPKSDDLDRVNAYPSYLGWAFKLPSLPCGCARRHGYIVESEHRLDTQAI